jgi:predicted TIM-barrel fold metal-dependent hydrolase
LSSAPKPAALPPGSVDTHTHVFEPQPFPYASDRVYTPAAAPTADLAQHLTRCGLDRVILVQPSVYGTNNDAHAAAIKTFGLSKARGVAVVDVTTISDAGLDQLHASGFRAARLNVKTTGVDDASAVIAAFHAAEKRLACLGWAIQIFATNRVVQGLAPAISTARVPVILDHYGSARPDDLSAVMAAVQSGNVTVKLSAPYRVASAPDFAAAAAMTRALVKARPDRMLWGSDWPHPGGAKRGPGQRDTIEPFIAHDDVAALRLFVDWVGDAATLKAIMVDNPHRLFFAD